MKWNSIFFLIFFFIFGFGCRPSEPASTSTLPKPSSIEKDEGTEVVEAQNAPSPAQEEIPAAQEDIPVTSELVSLPVPYVNESPDDSWTGSWKNACEEASLTMIDAYYAGKTVVTVEEAKAYMQTLFDDEKVLYGSDVNSDAETTLALLKDHSAVADGRVVENPTIEQIEKELDAGHPVISFHYGFDLHNKNIPFLATGTSYHATVIKGYDISAHEFIVQDTGDRVDGADHRYDMDLYMVTLHDYQESTKHADGPPRVIFTFAKTRP